MVHIAINACATMPTLPDLHCYRVGGSVRDELMGLPAGDRDWVVVGATPEQMIARGFRPVGKDFPVFLHPQTHEEYALARTERKTGPGYKGFAVHCAPDVTLEDDLLRRDLTINAMAVPACRDDHPPQDKPRSGPGASPEDDRRAAAVTTPPAPSGGRLSSGTPVTTGPDTTPPPADPPASAPHDAPDSAVRPEDGDAHTSQTALLARLIDPFGGLQDLRDRIFRHVSPAFREDPVRILRLARFAARFPDFSVADETLALMRTMSAAGEVDALVAERVWQELARGLMSQRPSRMLHVLDEAHALAILLPPLSPVTRHPAWLDALDASAAAHDPLPVRFAILMAGAVTGLPHGTQDTGAPPSALPAPATARTPDAHDRDAALPATRHAPTAGVPAPPSVQAAAHVEQLARTLRAPNDCLDAARRLAGEMPGPVPTAARQWLASPDRLHPAGLLALFNRHDAWRRPERLHHLLLAAHRLATARPDDCHQPPGHTIIDAIHDAHPHADAGTGGVHAALPPVPCTDDRSAAPADPSCDALPPPVIPPIRHALGAAQAVDTGAIARQHADDPQAIRSAIDTARTAAIVQALARA